jgi:hypothetical protein
MGPDARFLLRAGTNVCDASHREATAFMDDFFGGGDEAQIACFQQLMGAALTGYRTACRRCL